MIRATPLLFFLMTTPACALFCPGNFNSINIGDSLEEVKQQCGPASAEKESESSANLPQEWTYYVKMSPYDQATLKTTVAFMNGKVTNMSVNGAGVSDTAICGKDMHAGDTEDEVKSACGTPAFINRGNGSQEGSANTGKPTKITQLIYTTETAPVTLVFENGKLTSRK